MANEAAKPAAGGVPQRVGKYDVIRVLGEGATAKVYLCHDDFSKRDVAVKVISQSALQDMGGGGQIGRAHV